MTWSDDALRTRVTERAQSQNKSIRQVLSDAGLSHDTLDKKPQSGRRVDTLEKLAGALGWSLAQIMGFDEMSRHAVPNLLLTAYQMARRLLRNISDDEVETIELQAEIYDLLVDTEANGKITPEFLEDAERVYENVLRKRALRPQSRQHDR